MLDAGHSSHVLLQLGLLADALTLLRPSVENMIDIQYLHRQPDKVDEYDVKLNEFVEWLAGSQHRTIRRDPDWDLRFGSAGQMCRYIEENNPTEYEQRLGYQWRLLSNVAGHVTPERHLVNLKRPDDWINVVREVELTSRIAIHQLHDVEPQLMEMLASNELLTNRFRELPPAPIISVEYRE